MSRVGVGEETDCGGVFYDALDCFFGELDVLGYRLD